MTPLDTLHKKMLDGLTKLARLIAKKEVNTAIYPSVYRADDGQMVTDVPFLAVLDTPRASQIICDGSGKYDAWSNDGKDMLSTGLTRQQAAKLVTQEYFWAKATRVKARNPDADFDQIMAKLEAGYQEKNHGL